LTIDIAHVPANIAMAQTLIDLPIDEQPYAYDRAQTLMDSVTRYSRWDSTDAWYLLGKSYSLTGMPEEANKALWYCYALMDTQPVRAWDNAYPRWL